MCGASWGRGDLRRPGHVEHEESHVNVGGLVALSGLSYPDHPAFIFEDLRRTYGESLNRVDALGRALQDLGVNTGDRVAIYARNCPEYLECMFAIRKVGAVVVTLNASFTARELSWHLGDSEAVVRVGDSAGAEVITAARQENSALRCVVWVDRQDVREEHVWASDAGVDDIIGADSGGQFEAVEVSPSDLAWIGYTSGTTGTPKGAMLSHRSLMAQALSSFADVQRLEQHQVCVRANGLGREPGYLPLLATWPRPTRVMLRS
jgi:long-chain acyl-CoA synthetase